MGAVPVFVLFVIVDLALAHIEMLAAGSRFGLGRPAEQIRIGGEHSASIRKQHTVLRDSTV